MKVIDSSALIKYVSKEQGWELIKPHLHDASTIDLAIKELGNALWKKILKDEILLKEAKEILSECRLSIKIADQINYLGKSLEIATENKITFYDSLFIAMALEERIEIVTCDRRQAEVAAKTGVVVIQI